MNTEASVPSPLHDVIEALEELCLIDPEHVEVCFLLADHFIDFDVADGVEKYDEELSALIARLGAEVEAVRNETRTREIARLAVADLIEDLASPIREINAARLMHELYTMDLYDSGEISGYVHLMGRMSEERWDIFFGSMVALVEDVESGGLDPEEARLIVHEFMWNMVKSGSD